MTIETNFREYVVTLQQFDDLELFYTDMETEGGDLYIPDRAVKCHLRRPVSRNTHYMLSDQEAAQLQNDPRVLAVELTLAELGIELKPLWTQTSTRWNKSNRFSLSSGQLNWGLLRVTEGQQRPNWGVGGTTEVTGTVSVPFSGKNVDVVMVDGRLEINHPEFAVNVDGTGGSRIVQYNWYNLNPTVTGGSAATYSYTPADSANDWHGTFCAAIVAGNTQGWARDANIYQIYPYGAAPSVASDFLWDYIKVWHLSKSINPATGLKNPSIVNASIGYSFSLFLNQITSITYRGVTYPRPQFGSFTIAEARNFGLAAYTIGSSNYVDVPVRNVAVDADVADCISAGIIIVGAAGNESTKANVSSSIDYNNTLTIDLFPGFQLNYSRGTTPGATNNTICVGAIGADVNPAGEEKATYSNCGPRVDVFAPGSNIRSAVNNNWESISTQSVADSRNPSFKIAVSSGTSFASPQIAGILATILEVNPTLTPAAALSYITSNAKTSQIYSTSNLDFYDLQGAPNRYSFAKYSTTIAITSNTNDVIPLQNIVYTITLTDVPNGSLVYLTDSGTSTSGDFVDGVRQFVLTVNAGTASLTRTASAGITGLRTSILQLRTGGYDGNIQATASAVNISAGDFVIGSGSFTIDTQGTGFFTVTPLLDSVTEGAETFTVSILTGSTIGNVVKTSNPITINDA
jgi:subtilisin family serine protease